MKRTAWVSILSATVVVGASYASCLLKLQRAPYLKSRPSKPTRLEPPTAASLLAQALTEQVAFEVASIKPNNNDLQPITSDRIRWQIAREKAGLPALQLRDLRHEAGSRFDEAGVPTSYVSKIPGQLEHHKPLPEHPEARPSPGDGEA